MSNEIAMPGQVEEIIKRLTDSGFEAYAVGGCVRDSLLNREPGDWDITTSASPRQVKEIFRRTIDTGIEHGTVTVMPVSYTHLDVYKRQGMMGGLFWKIVSMTVF